MLCRSLEDFDLIRRFAQVLRSVKNKGFRLIIRAMNTVSFSKLASKLVFREKLV